MLALGAVVASILPRKRDGGIVWVAQIRKKRGGKVVYSESKSFASEPVARAWAEKREAALGKPGAIEAAANRGVTVAKVLDWYEQDYDGATKFGRSKMGHINFLMEYEPLASSVAAELTSADLVRHAQQRHKEGTGPATINNDFIWLRSAFRSARIGRALDLPEQALEDAAYLCRKERLIGKSKPRMRRPERRELEMLLVWFSPSRRRSKIPMQDIVLFAVFSGRRQEEICTIRWADFDGRRGRVLVRDMKHPREKIDTWVDLPEPALAVIKRQPKVNDLIFPCDPKSVGGKFANGCKMLGIDDLRFHDLRHECASWLFERGWDIPRVARVTGHKSWATLQRYTHLSTGEVFDRWADWEWLPKMEEKL